MLSTLQTIEASDNYNRWLYTQIRPFISGSILDIGSGLGTLAHYYPSVNVHRVIVSDFNEAMLTILRERFGDQTMFTTTHLKIDCEQSLKLFSYHPVDRITCLNVLEHIADDGKALRHMHHLLAGDGKLVILVPALPAIFGSLDVLVGHYRRYIKKSLRKLLAKNGFVVEQLFYINFFGLFSWLIAGKLLKHQKFSQGICRNLDRLVPAFESLERACPPPIGQSLIAVASKGSH